jgi:uncharacterized membrane-anchored protein YhcB (DUF1043 family)
MATSPQTTRVPAPKDGAVTVTTAPDVTEKEIAEERDSIVQRLHASYLNLQDHMAEFQQQWDDNPTLAVLVSAQEGWNAGGADWLKDQAELFEKKTWVDFGQKIGKFAGQSYDRLAVYSKQRYQDIQTEVNKLTENPEDTLYNWSWWQTTISDEAEQIAREQYAKLYGAAQSVKASAQTVLNTAEKAKKIYQHRDATLNLPTLIAQGQPKPIQAFVDNQLMDIDPELAKAIKNNPNFPLVLEIIADHDSALTYLSYMSLMLEAIPPNFYAYAAGKGSAYLMIEVVLLVVTALLSAGAAVAARIGMLIARFAAASAKIASVGKKLKKAKAAIDAFIRILEDLSDAVDRLHALGAKLVKARSKGLQIKGSTKSTLVAKKESVKRDKKCRLCGSTEHTTPRSRQGTVQYV